MLIENLKLSDLIKRTAQKETVTRFLDMIRKDKSVFLSVVVLCTLVFSAVFADFLSPYSYDEISLENALLPPSIEHLFGTDWLGRDILSRLLYGSRIVIYVTLAVTVLAATIGIFIGLISGYFGRMVDIIIQRIIDIVLSFPALLLALAVLSVLGIGLNNAVMAVAISQVAIYARFVRGLVLLEKEKSYIESTRALGAGNARIIFLHLLPNIMFPILVQITLLVVNAILSISALSFLGLGAQPPTPDWGLMIYEGRLYLRTKPYIVFFPGLAICLIALALSILGEAMRDVFIPELRFKDSI